jgi:membrane fusion protein, multidrug efflux system
MRRRIINIWPARIAFFGITVTGLFNSCNTSEVKTGEQKQNVTRTDLKPAPETFNLQKGMIATIYRTPGELIAFQQVDLYAKENSFVKKLFVDVGSEVKEGQLLAELEAPELASRIAGAESRLKSQEAVYTASKANYDRLMETSKTPGTISPNDLDQATARKNADYAQLEAAKASYKEVTIVQSYLQIRAPFNGIISSRNVNTGAYVGPSGKGSELPLFTLQAQKRLRLVVAVPELYTGYLNIHNEISFTVKSLPGEMFTGKIKRLSGALDAKLRAERIELDVANNSKRLLPGMIAEVTIPLPSRDSAFIVPKTAIVNSIEKVFVIRVNNHQAEWVTVQKGRDLDSVAEIYGALQPGDELVKKASEEIRNGSVFKKN